MIHPRLISVGRIITPVSCAIVLWYYLGVFGILALMGAWHFFRTPSHPDSMEENPLELSSRDLAFWGSLFLLVTGTSFYYGAVAGAVLVSLVLLAGGTYIWLTLSREINKRT
jgi:hypothetical protein